VADEHHDDTPFTTIGGDELVTMPRRLGIPSSGS